MKRTDIKLANEILELYVSCSDKMTAQEEIALSGPTQETKMIEFLGDFPQLSNVKPDILSVKVDKMRKFYISRDEHIAYRAVKSLPKQARPYAVGYTLVKNKHNSITKKPHTHADVAKALGKPLDAYEQVRENALKLLIIKFKSNMRNTRYGAELCEAS